MKSRLSRLISAIAISALVYNLESPWSIFFGGIMSFTYLKLIMINMLVGFICLFAGVYWLTSLGHDVLTIDIFIISLGFSLLVKVPILISNFIFGPPPTFTWFSFNIPNLLATLILFISGFIGGLIAVRVRKKLNRNIDVAAS